MECFTADFYDFFQKASKVGFWVAGWVLAIESRSFTKRQTSGASSDNE